MIRAPALFVVLLIGEVKPDVAIANIAKNTAKVGHGAFLFFQFWNEQFWNEITGTTVKKQQW